MKTDMREIDLAAQGVVFRRKDGDLVLHVPVNGFAFVPRPERLSPQAVLVEYHAPAEYDAPAGRLLGALTFPSLASFFDALQRGQRLLEVDE